MKLLLTILMLLSLSCSQRGVSSKDDAGGGTFISDGDGGGTIYIVEKDGYKFAVLIGLRKGCIIQLKD